MTPGVPQPALKREIGTLGVAATTANIIMGSGLFVIPAALGVLGGWAPVAIIACGLVMACVALVFAEASSRVPAAGGAYGFVAEALGPVAAAVVGGLVLLSGTLAGGGILAAALDQLRPFWPWAAEAGRPFVVIAVCALFAGNAMLGAKASARSVEMAMAVKLVPLLLFIVLAALLPTAAAVAPPAAPTLAVAAPLLILGIYLFAGLESAVVMNGEVRNPARTIPRGLFLALALFALLAIAIQIVAARALGPALAGSSAPLVEAAARVGPWLPPIVAAGAVVSMTACVAGLAIANPRTIFAFARDGLLPAPLARLHPRTRAPGIAIAINAALFALLAIVGEFAPLAAASSLASMSVYVIGAAAFFVLRRRGVTQAGPVLAFAAAPIAGAVAIGANLAIILGASGRELGALAAAIAAFVLLAVVRTRRPALARA